MSAADGAHRSESGPLRREWSPPLTAHRSLRFWARAYAAALLVHSGLPDYDSEGWGWPRALKLAAALVLAFRPHALGFGLALGTSLYTLLFLRDVLTQQVILAVMGAAGLAAAPAGTRAAARAALAAVVAVTACTYLLAALHKLNSDFLDPEVSCAHHAFEQVRAFWFEWAGPLPRPGVWLAVMIIAWELVLARLLLRGSAWVWPLGVAFHLPLTVTLAPAFGAVMLAGYAAATGPRTLVRWRRVWRRRPAFVALGSAGLLLLDVVAHGGVSPWDGRVKVALSGGLLALAILGRGPRERPRLGRTGLVVGGLCLLHGLLPYVGLKVQHSAAMLSNLRVDPACHNSLVVSPALLVRDPYIYVDDARIGDGLRPERVEILKTQLWSVAALHAAHDNWCVPEQRPIRLVGHWRDACFEIPDLCADDFAAHLPEAGFPPATFLPYYQALQKNLPRACHVACVH